LASVLQDRSPDSAGIAGPGLFDMTRLAMSSYDLWNDILRTNAPEITLALDSYIARLQAIKENFESEFANGARFASSLRSR
jgi:prephenate dehydrogenase